MADQKVCAKCGAIKSIGWHFCRKDKVHICYTCYQKYYACPVCKSSKDLVKVS